MNIHILSNSPTRVNSGFGIVTRNLALGLQKLGHNISISDMQNIYNKEYWNDICIYPMNSVVDAATGNSFYSNELTQLSRNLKESKAEILLIVYPAYNNVISSNRLHEIHKNTVWYYPVEGENIPSAYINELKKVRCVVPMTKQGKGELKKSGLGNISKLSSREKEIYHGFDKDIFKPLDISNGNGKNKSDNNDLHYCIWSLERYWMIGDRKELCSRGCFNCNGLDDNCKYYKEEEIIINVFGEEFKGNVSNLSTLRDQFGIETIFGFTGENNGMRKKIDRLLNSFSILDKSNDVKSSETLLLMHTMPVSNNGLNLWEYVRRYKLNEVKNNKKINILFTYGGDGLGNSWSDKALNIMYNVIDVNISCSSGEGFGMPTTESMACGKPQIAPNFSSFTELIKGDDSNNNDDLNKDNIIYGSRGLLCDIEGYEKLDNGIKRALVSPKSISNSMQIMHENKNLRDKLGSNAYNWVQQYTWENICNDFNILFNEMGN